MDPLAESARRDPRGPAVEGPSASGRGRIRWAWSELDRVVDRTVLRLVEAGVRLGDGVAVLLPPSPEGVALLHALPRAGALLLPLNPRWTRHELHCGLETVPHPRLLLAAPERVDRLRREFPGVGTVAVDEIVDPGEAVGPHEVGDPSARRVGPELTADTPVAVLLTSGSTGRPRPIPLTHGNLMASARGSAERLRLGPTDAWLASLSPAHVGGLALQHRAAVVGSLLVTRPAFDPAGFLTLAGRGEVSHASLVPVMLRRVLDAAGGAPPPRGLRCLLVGGAPTSPALLDRALAGRWPVALTYGLTEASSQVATAPPERVREKPGSAGAPLPGVDVAIRDPDERGVGEIVVRGPTVALLAAAPRGRRSQGGVFVDESGRLRTGDLGRLDDEGDLWVHGRATDRIVSGGVTVEPAEVEAVLDEHPEVSRSAVIGVPDEEWGQRVVALVVPADPSAPPDEGGLLAFARERLSSGRRPRIVRIVTDLPLNANGKVDRAALVRDWTPGAEEDVSTP